jgi:hypothetical protein
MSAGRVTLGTLSIGSSGNNRGDIQLDAVVPTGVGKGTYGNAELSLDAFEANGQGHYLGSATLNTFSITSTSGGGGFGEVSLDALQVNIQSSNPGQGVISFDVFSITGWGGGSGSASIDAPSVVSSGKTGGLGQGIIRLNALGMYALAGGFGKAKLDVLDVTASGEAINLGTCSITLRPPSVDGVARAGYKGTAEITLFPFKAKGSGYVSNLLQKEGTEIKFPSFSVTGSGIVGTIGSGSVEIFLSTEGTALVGWIGSGVLELPIEIKGSGFSCLVTSLEYDDDDL